MIPARAGAISVATSKSRKKKLDQALGGGRSKKYLGIFFLKIKNENNMVLFFY